VDIDMTISRYRNSLIAAGIALTLSIGVAGCGKTPDYSSKEAPAGGASQAATATSDAAKATAEAARETGEAATQAVSDTWITTKIKSVLLADSDAKGLDVSVHTQDGVVTLGGALETQVAVDHVKTLAADVEGVKRIDSAMLTVARR
jgi:hyperosmotically inducible periplasmic protein